jgi:hypothetical protein
LLLLLLVAAAAAAAVSAAAYNFSPAMCSTNGYDMYIIIIQLNEIK